MATNSGTVMSQSDSTVDTPAGYRLRWGAIFGGVLLALALSWLLLLLGSAIGVGIADATDLAAMGDGLGVGSIIWLLLTSLIATFCGAAMAAKSSGVPDERIGALHGLVVWSATVLLTLLLGSSAIGTAVNSVGKIVTDSANLTASIVSGGSESDDWEIPQSVEDTVGAALKRQLSTRLSAVSEGADQPTSEEIQRSIDALSSEDFGAVSSALISGNPEAARERLASRTELSEEQIRSVVDGMDRQIEQMSEDPAVEEVTAMVEGQLDDLERSASRALSDFAGPELKAREIRRTIDQLDAQTSTDIARRLINGDVEGAKDILTARTALDDADVEAVVSRVDQEVSETIAEVKSEVDAATETIGTYAQASLWAAFVATALGLIAGLFGGHVGAQTVRRLHVATVVTR